MDMHVRLDMDDDGPVVVKTATPAAVDHLRLEIARLRQAAHPGVVPVVGFADSPACELRTRYSGEPVSGWAGTVTSVAGLGASVATTLADLHSLGLVHGRIDASHILVADDGRPRLCSFSHPGGAAPADDVAALACVMSYLLDQTRPADAGSGVHRWLGRSHARVQERALRLVLQRADDPVPTRRPNARVLADAILAAVPTAELPPPTRPTTPTTTVPTPDVPVHVSVPVPIPGAEPKPPSHRPTPPAATFSGAAPPSGGPWAAGPSGEPPIPGPRPEHPDAQPAPPSQRPTAPQTVGAPVPSTELPGPSRWSAGRDAEGALPDWRHTGSDGPGAPLSGAKPAPSGRQAGGFEPPDPSQAPRRNSAEPDTLERIWSAAEQGSEAERWARAVGSGPPDLPLVEVSTPSWGPAPGPPVQPGPSSDDDSGLTVERPELAGRGGLGGRPGPASDPPAAPRRGRRRLVAAVLGIVSVVALTGAAAWASHRESPPRAAGVATLPPPGCPRVPPPAADVDGDGCPDQLKVDGAVVTSGLARWTLGEPGDRVALGDWDCDGSASAALLRPPTGDVFVFPAWAELGSPLSVTPIQRVAGAVDIHTEPEGPTCDSLVVDLATGPPRTIEVPD